VLSRAAKVLLRQASGLPQEPELVGLDLTDEGRSMLVDGLLDWGGPARCSETVAIAMRLARVGDRGVVPRCGTSAVLSSEGRLRSPGTLGLFGVWHSVRVPVGDLPLPVLAAVDLGRAKGVLPWLSVDGSLGVFIADCVGHVADHVGRDDLV
jgi:hypothetical protein